MFQLEFKVNFYLLGLLQILSDLKSTILILKDARVSSFLLFIFLIFLSAVSPLVQHDGDKDLPQTEELNNTETNQIQTSKEKEVKDNKVIEGTFTSLKITIGGKLFIYLLLFNC